MIKTKQAKPALTPPAPVKEEDCLKLAEVLLDLMGRLSGVMEEELTMLAGQSFEAMPGLRERKTRLVRDYQVNIATLAHRPDMLKQAPAPLRARLREAGEKLAEVTKRNAISLKAAVAATQTLIQTVVDTAKEKVKPSDCYADPRKSPLMLGSYSPMCDPVAVNRTA